MDGDVLEDRAALDLEVSGAAGRSVRSTRQLLESHLSARRWSDDDVQACALPGRIVEDNLLGIVAARELD